MNKDITGSIMQSISSHLPYEKYAQTHEENKRWHLIEAILNLLEKSKLQVGNLIEKQVNCKRALTTKLSPFWDIYFAQQKRK